MNFEEKQRDEGKINIENGQAYVKNIHPRLKGESIKLQYTTKRV